MGLPLLFLLSSLFAGGIYAEEFLSSKFQKVLNSIFSIAVKIEIDEIAKTVYLDTIDETAPTPETFSTYLRQEMRMRHGAMSKRDTSKDFWGTPYSLRIAPKTVLVTSAGPDQSFGTRDDIRGGYNSFAGIDWRKSAPMRHPASVSQDQPPRSYTAKEYKRICEAFNQHLRTNGIVPKSDCSSTKARAMGRRYSKLQKI